VLLKKTAIKCSIRDPLKGCLIRTNYNMQNYSQIYLVDDFDMMNHLHKKLFGKLKIGEEINVFTNPEEALVDMRLKLWNSERILILLDINMPEMSGFEFLDVMVEEDFPHKIDVIIVTSSISGKDRAKADEYPQFVRNFITKPINIDHLKKILKPLSKAS